MSDTIGHEIETIVAVYGVANNQGDILTEQAALQLFNQLKAQETMPLDEIGYYISDVKIEGDRTSGKITAKFRFK